MSAKKAVRPHVRLLSCVRLYLCAGFHACVLTWCTWLVPSSLALAGIHWCNKIHCHQNPGTPPRLFLFCTDQQIFFSSIYFLILIGHTNISQPPSKIGIYYRFMTYFSSTPLLCAERGAAGKLLQLFTPWLPQNTP